MCSSNSVHSNNCRSENGTTLITMTGQNRSADETSDIPGSDSKNQLSEQDHQKSCSIKMLRFLIRLVLVYVFPVGFFTYKAVLAEAVQLNNSFTTLNFYLCVKDLNDYRCYFWSVYWLVFCLFLIIFECLKIGPNGGTVEISLEQNVATDDTITLLHQITPWTLFYCSLFAIPGYFSYQEKCFQFQRHLDLPYVFFRWLFVIISVVLPLLFFLIMPLLSMISKTYFKPSIVIRWKDGIDQNIKQMMTDNYKKAFNLCFLNIYAVVFYFIYQYLL